MLPPILTVDPGKLTGWGVYLDGQATFAHSEFMTFHGQALAWLDNCVVKDYKPLVVAERFVITANTIKKSRGDTNWSIETIGVLRFLCHRYGFDFELQGPSEAKKFGTDALIRKLGWWTRGSDHARDAARHLALALARHYPSELDRLLLDAEHRV